MDPNDVVDEFGGQFGGLGGGDHPADHIAAEDVKIASMLEKACENNPAPPPRPAAASAGRFARDAAEFATGRGHLRLVHDATAPVDVHGEQVR